MRKRKTNKYNPLIAKDSVFFTLPWSRKRRYVMRFENLKPSGLIAWDIEAEQWRHLTEDESFELCFWVLEKHKVEIGMRQIETALNATPPIITINGKKVGIVPDSFRILFSKGGANSPITSDSSKTRRVKILKETKGATL